MTSWDLEVGSRFLTLKPRRGWWKHVFLGSGRFRLLSAAKSD